ncbi:MAG: molybdenum cofactor biosynthesis protein B [Oligoflexales bacterium]
MFQKINIAVLTVSDSRTFATDRSGDYLRGAISEFGHCLYERKIVPDNIYKIRAATSTWIADPKCDAIISTGGTGVTGRDGTPEALVPLFDKELPGFGEVFRTVSFEEIGTSTIQSRCVAGVANATYIFVLPGSTGACKTGWNGIIKYQLDSQTKPCNLIELMPRLQEN